MTTKSEHLTNGQVQAIERMEAQGQFSEEQKTEQTVNQPPTTTPAKQPEITKSSLPKKLLDAGFSSVLMSPKQTFLKAGGTEVQFNREVNFAAQLLMNSDYLFKCAQQYPEHFIEAMKNVALTGLTLNPELRLAYLVPYKGKVKFQSSYMGKTEILIRAGVVQAIEANLVFERDTFKAVKGLNQELTHEPDYFASDRGKIKGGYWLAITPNGQKKFDVMPQARVEEIKARSEAVKAGNGCPWDTDYEEMAKKTIINWAFKSLPKTNISESMIKVLEAEGDFEREEFEDWKKTQVKQDRFEEDAIQDAVIVQ